MALTKEEIDLELEHELACLRDLPDSDLGADTGNGSDSENDDHLYKLPHLNYADGTHIHVFLLVFIP